MIGPEEEVEKPTEAKDEPDLQGIGGVDVAWGLGQVREGVNVVELGLVLDGCQFQQAVASTTGVEIGLVQEEMRYSRAAARGVDAAVGEAKTKQAAVGIVQVVA